MPSVQYNAFLHVQNKTHAIGRNGYQLALCKKIRRKEFFWYSLNGPVAIYEEQYIFIRAGLQSRLFDIELLFFITFIKGYIYI